MELLAADTLTRWEHLSPLGFDLARLGRGPADEPNERVRELVTGQWCRTFDSIEALQCFIRAFDAATPSAQEKFEAIAAIAGEILASPRIRALQTGRVALCLPGPAASTPEESSTARRRLIRAGTDRAVENRMNGITFVYRQLVATNGIWESVPQHAPDVLAVQRGVQAGHLVGQPRWAIRKRDDEAGELLFGLDAKGKPLTREQVEAWQAQLNPAQDHPRLQARG